MMTGAPRRRRRVVKRVRAPLLNARARVERLRARVSRLSSRCTFWSNHARLNVRNRAFKSPGTSPRGASGKNGERNGVLGTGRPDRNVTRTYDAQRPPAGAAPPVSLLGMSTSQPRRRRDLSSRYPRRGRGAVATTKKRELAAFPGAPTAVVRRLVFLGASTRSAIPRRDDITTTPARAPVAARP